jgi:hypothetical protein
VRLCEVILASSVAILTVGLACTPFGSVATGQHADAATDSAPANGGPTVDASKDASTEDSVAPLQVDYASIVRDDKPIAYWRLGDAVTPLARDEMQKHDGTYKGGITLGVPGALKNDADTAARFDGNGSVEIAASTVFDFVDPATFSVEAWVKRSDGDAILGKETYGPPYQGWFLVFNGEPVPTDLNFWRMPDEVVTPKPPDDVFHHYVVTFDGFTLVLFVDGALKQSQLSTTGLGPNPAPLILGQVPNWGSFVGVLDEVAIYDKALSPARILRHYQFGAGL